VAARRRAAVARRRHAHDPALLREVLRLLPHIDTKPDFLAPPETRRVEPDTAVALRAKPGRVLGGRWRLGREIGRGGEGLVCEAFDRVTRTRAAVKLLRRSEDRDHQRLRREAATLRWLRLPGVVEILEDGIDAGVMWIATEFLDASPFPGPLRRHNWQAVEPLALGLLEAVGRVHAAGIVHGDLKPSNVLVNATGHVTLLDLGLAAARTDRFTQPGEFGGGTPGYLAPECLEGTAPDVRSDVFAVGVILFEALAPRAARRSERRDCRRLAAPGRVQRAIARLLARDPSRRPASAAEAIRQLRPAPRTRRRRPWTRAELRERFQGPDRFLHLREDAARELFRRTAGGPSAVENELTSWMRAGLARMEGGLVVVDRGALDRLAALGRPHRGPAGELARALRSGRPRDVVRAALRQATFEFDTGRSSRALAALEEGAAAARAVGDLRALREIARRAVNAAINSAVGRDIDRALWLVQRGGEADEDLTALADVARAAAEMQRGHVEAAWRIATRVTRDGPRLALRSAWSVREMAARALGPRHRRAVVAESVRWVRADGSEDARALRRTWRAWAHYLDGRCSEALHLHSQGLATERNPSLRARMTIDAAAAALDAGQESLAVERAREAMAIARRLKRPVQEVRAWMVLRSARYRRGDRLAVDLEAISAIECLGFRGLSQYARMAEGAIAWRRGDRSLVRAVVHPEVSRLDPRSATNAQLLAAALDVASGAVPSRVKLRALIARALAATPPAVSTQILALLASGLPLWRETLRRRCSRLRVATKTRDRSRRREVLSLDEAAAMLGLTS
jgi:hypothetical protein